MGCYAEVTDSIVTNITLCDDADHADQQGWVPIDDITPTPGIGWGYDGQTWTAPDAPSDPPPLTIQVDPQALSDVLDQAQAATTVATLRESVTTLVELLRGSV